MRLRVQSLALLSGLTIGVAVNCGVGRRHGWDSTLLWLWRRLVATVLIRPLAWEPPYAAGEAQEMAKRQKKKKRIIHHVFRSAVLESHYLGSKPSSAIMRPLVTPFNLSFLGPLLWHMEVPRLGV